MGIAEITQGKAWKNFMAKLYGFGASIVIIGALFKIQHWPGAGLMLTVGLLTEAVIFFFSAFEPPHEDVDWSLVYPELAGMHGDEKEKLEDKGSLTEQLDTMLEEAKIGPELINSLGDGLRSLSDNASKMSNITDAAVATNEYADRMRSATKKVDDLSNAYSQASTSVSSSVSELTGAYAKATSALQGLSNSTTDAQAYSEQLSQVTKNLSALNAAYELQLQGSNEHAKATKKLYDGIEELMKNLSDSVDDTRKYRTEMTNLADNLMALNTIYGNMLSALNYKK